MRPKSLLSLCALASALFCSTAVIAQVSAPAVRIVNRIDESQLVTLKGNTLPAANAKNDRGRVSSDLPMTDLILVLSRSPEQQAAFDKFVASQYDANSPNYHHWLEPEEVGADFGPSETDIATLSSWLIGRGFSVDEVSKDRMTIRFSGTAGTVESAFHTEIHNLEVKGNPHIANMADPQIPAALAPAVVGVKALHNFFPKPLHRVGSQVTRDSKTGKWRRISGTASGSIAASAETKMALARPQFGTSDSSGNVYEDLSPYDFATIYNVLPLWNASTAIDGTGQTIAIAGTSNIVLSDVAKFRSVFGLPTKAPTVVIANGTNPGACTSTSSRAACTLDDQIENALDVEWAGAVAKGANIVLVVSGSNSSTTDTLYSSESYIVNHKTANIMNVSYGECELGMGTAGNLQYYNLWSTAASEGIAVFVASGDQAAATCDAGNDTSTPYPAQYGLSVSGLASTPYNTAVGGTDFTWCNPTDGCGSASPYWNSSNGSNGASAKGYVPEAPWNDTCASEPVVTYLEDAASSIGVSGVQDAESACNFVFDYYGYIYNYYGVDLSWMVDITGGGGGKSACVVNDGSTLASCKSTITTTGGTTPIALYHDGWVKPSWQAGVTGIPADGVRDIPDVSFFASNGMWDSAYLICVTAAGSCTSSSTDSTVQEVGGTSVSAPAMAGVMALINQKAGASQGNPNAELYALAAKQTYASCNAASVTNSGTCDFNDITTGNISVPCWDGDQDCTATTSGDQLGILGYDAGTGYDLATGLGSLNVYNVVNDWPASTTNPSFALSDSGDISVAGGATTGNTSTISVTPSGGFTGAVALTCAVSPTAASSPATCALSPTSVSITGTAALTSTLTLTTTSSTTAGTYTVTVTGTSGSTTQTTAVTLTVTSATSTGTFALSNGGNITVAAGATTGNTSTISVTPSGGFTGAVALTCAVSPTAASSPATCAVSPASVSIAGTAALTATLTLTTTSSTTPGTYTVTVTGTSGSATATTPVTLTVTSTTSTGSFALSNGGNVTVARGATTGNTSTITVTPSGGFTGTVALTCAISPSASNDPATCSLSPTSVTISDTGAKTATLTVSTTAAASALNRTNKLFWPSAGGTALALVFLFGIPKRRRNWLAMLGLLVLVISIAGMGCGGSTPTGSGDSGTTAGTYTVTVTGTSGSTTQTTAVTLTVN